MFYLECPKNDIEIMTSSLRGSISETLYDQGGSVGFSGEKLLFSELYAWCVQKSIIPSNQYSENAEVNLKDTYMIYSLKVDGFREQLSISSDRNLAKDFKIQYALEDKIWAYYEGGNVVSILQISFSSKLDFIFI